MRTFYLSCSFLLNINRVWDHLFHRFTHMYVVYGLDADESLSGICMDTKDERGRENPNTLSIKCNVELNLINFCSNFNKTIKFTPSTLMLMTQTVTSRTLSLSQRKCASILKDYGLWY